MTASYASLIKICERLERAKRHGLTPFWSTVAERLYGGDADTLVAQVGRGGIKSGFGSRIALNEVINGDFEVPQGELHYWIDVSENKAEASQRLRQYENYLDVLGIAYERRGDEVVIPELRRGFLVRAFDAGKLAGFRAIGVRFDELAKAAPDAAEGREVVSSAVAMTITHVRHRPKLLLLSAPTGKTNFHFLQFSEGDGHGQIAVHAPTWEANPTVTREDTLRKCSHEPTWLMEYAAVASDTISGLFFGERALNNSTDADEERHFLVRGNHNVISTDAAFTENGDKFGVVVCSHEEGDWIASEGGFKRDLSMVRVHETHAWRADRSPREMARRLKHEVCDRYGTTRIVIDEHEASSFKELAQDVGLQPKIQKWTGGDHVADNWGSSTEREVMSKTQRYKIVRAAMLDGRVRFPNDPSLLAEFRTIYSEITAAGNEVVRARRTAATGHADRISALVLGVSIALVRTPHEVPERWSAEDYHRARLEWNRSNGCYIGAYHPVFNYGRTRQGVCLEWPDFVRLIKNRAQRISPPKAA